MYIAICDDNKNDILHICSLLDQYKMSRKAAFTYKCFVSGLDLLNTMKDEPFDLIFLDIVMPLINGIDLSKELRENGSTATLILLTSSPEFALQGYEVNAHRYLLKPATQDTLFSILDSLFLQVEEASLSLKTCKGFSKVPFSKILFVEVYAKKVHFHLNNATILEVHGTLADFEPLLLEHKDFLKCHRSYIINLAHITDLDAKSATMSNEKIVPISRASSKKVKDAYMLNWFDEEGL